MNDREEQTLRILRRNPLIQQNETADILQISRSRVAAHIMDLIHEGMIKGKDYILTEQDYCMVVGAINMDIRGVADINYPQAASNPSSIRCLAGGVGRNITHNLALLGRDVHLTSAVGDGFYDGVLLEQMHQVGVNVSSCICLHGHNTSTYLSITSQQEEAILAINDTHILQQLTPQPLSDSQDLIRHSGVILADCNLTAGAVEWVLTVADNIPVFIDTASEFKVTKMKTWFTHIHTLKPTQKKLSILWGQPIHSDTDRVLTASSLHQQEVKRIFACLEDESVLCSEKDGKQFLLTPPEHATVDSFGADDAFMTGLLYSFLEGNEFRESAHFTMACATLSRASISVNSPTLSADNALHLLRTA